MGGPLIDQCCEGDEEDASELDSMSEDQDTVS